MTGRATDVTDVPTELSVDAVQKRANLGARSTSRCGGTGSPKPCSFLVMAPCKQTPADIADLGMRGLGAASKSSPRNAHQPGPHRYQATPRERVASSRMEAVDYTDTFIVVAPDSTAVTGSEPPVDTIAGLTYRMIAERPYELRSSDVIFEVWADRQAIPPADRKAARVDFYSKPRACLRSSDLGKKWGWGIHADEAGRVGVYAVDSPEYERLASGTTPDGRPVKVRAAMRGQRRPAPQSAGRTG